MTTTGPRGRAAGALLATLLLAFAAPADEDFADRIAAEPGGALEVRLDRGSVEVETHDRAEVRVEATDAGGAGLALTREQSRIVLRSNPGVLGWLGGGDLEVHVRVPRSFSLDLRTSGGEVEVEGLAGRVSVRTSGGSVEVSDIAGEADVRTSGGEVEVSQVRGAVVARTSGGDIGISEVEGPVEAETSGGTVEVKDVRGPVHVRTSGGPIEVRFTAPPEGALRTSGGAIVVEFPEGAGLDLDARTRGGGVDLDPPLVLEGRVERDRVEGRVNGGGARLEVRTSGGPIEIRQR